MFAITREIPTDRHSDSVTIDVIVRPRGGQIKGWQARREAVDMRFGQSYIMSSVGQKPVCRHSACSIMGRVLPKGPSLFSLLGIDGP